MKTVGKRTAGFLGGGARGVRAVVAALLLTVVLAACAAAASFIGEERAREIALKQAGVSASEARVLKVARYEKRGVSLYDVVLLTDSAKYSCEIDAETGEVIAFFRRDIRGGKRLHEERREGEARQGERIGVERAKRIAFDHAKVSEAEVRKLEVELDRDDGLLVYEIEFKHGGMEYEYEIDAHSGAILRWKADRD